MRNDLIRVYKTVHTWTGVICGLALFICFYAGAITMFKDALADWVTPPASAHQLVELGEVPALLDKVLRVEPEARGLLSLRFKDREHAWLTWTTQGGAQRASATLDQAGQLHVEARHPSNVPAFIDVLHMTAGVPGGFSVGMGVMGVVSLFYGLALVSGVIVLLPTLIKDLFVLRIGKNLKRMWLDAHNVVGILSLPFHLVMALSVVGFGLHDWIYATQDAAFYGGKLQPMLVAQNPFYASSGTQVGSTNLLPPAELIAKVRANAPGFEPSEMIWQRPGQPGATVFIAGSDPRYLVRSGGFALMDPVTGRFVNKSFLPGDGNGNGWSATATAIYALHFGSYGGAPVKWGYFLLGLAGAFLFYSGNLLWIESRRKSARADAPDVRQRRSADVLAALTVGVTLGCINGISLSLVAGKLLSGRIDDMPSWHASIYYIVFLGSIGWAFLRGAPRAALELLLLAVAASAAIPLSSLAGWLWPSTGLWAGGSTGSLAVDCVAAIGSACFAWMWRATARRVTAGRADSVWFDARQKSAVIENKNVRGLP
ncbi:MAG: PepSY-associated TM helix domain-containing protein [Pararobbsia sp.]